MRMFSSSSIGPNYHTVNSHGVELLKTHMYDWLLLVLLVVIEILLNLIEPFHRFVGEGMMTDLKYPLKKNTIPFAAVPVIAILVPIVVFILFYIRRRDVYDLHHAILGILYSVLVTGVITDAIKDGVGRPRPDFFWRCFPDGNAVFHPVTRDVMCTGITSVIREGYKSFPSGHTSWSFAGMSFFACYICGKFRVFNQRGNVAKLCIVFLPLLVAALVAMSQGDDYQHHWQDIFAGGHIGMTVASFCYIHFFPPPYDTNGWGPHAYFHSLSESQRSQNSTDAVSLNSYPDELQNVTTDPRSDIENDYPPSTSTKTEPPVRSRRT